MASARWAAVLVAWAVAAPAAAPGQQPALADAGMVVVGAFAIDRYEYPNQPGVLPLVDVSWVEADSLCARQGKRLCTESEWQLAAGGPERLLFGYGTAFAASRCNTPYPVDGIWKRDRGLVPSGSFADCCSPAGACDMVGNAWEWVADTSAAHPGGRIVRGGSWFNSVHFARTDARYPRYLPSSFRLDLIGLRCCGSVPPSAADAP